MGAEGEGEPTLRLVQVQGCHLTVGVLWSHASPGAACGGAGVSHMLSNKTSHFQLNSVWQLGLVSTQQIVTEQICAWSPTGTSFPGRSPPAATEPGAFARPHALLSTSPCDMGPHWAYFQHCSGS